LELDDKANVISYEEYAPYGSTTYQAADKSINAAAKRYRYSGKERDNETGLFYHGARYFAPWLGRWTSCDPAGIIDGANIYGYSRNSPITLADPNGKQSTVPQLNLLPPNSRPIRQIFPQELQLNNFATAASNQPNTSFFYPSKDILSLTREFLRNGITPPANNAPIKAVPSIVDIPQGYDRHPSPGPVIDTTQPTKDTSLKLLDRPAPKNDPSNWRLGSEPTVKNGSPGDVAEVPVVKGAIEDLKNQFTPSLEHDGIEIKRDFKRASTLANFATIAGASALVLSILTPPIIAAYASREQDVPKETNGKQVVLSGLGAAIGLIKVGPLALSADFFANNPAPSSPSPVDPPPDTKIGDNPPLLPSIPDIKLNGRGVNLNLKFEF
jgi:hypothetical protein